MPESAASTGDVAPKARPGKRTRLVAAACDLLYQQGVERTTLADIAQAADVPLGNVYYYFKAKDDITAAVVQAHVDEIESLIAALERQHRSPKARLKALVGVVAEQRDMIAGFGCPHGTLCSELTKRSDERSKALAAQLMQTLVGWVEQQFAALGRRDAHDLAIELVVLYQGAAVVSNALGEPLLFSHQARRLQKWIETLPT